MNTKGIWLYGLAGSGKSFGSNIIAKSIQNSFVIDGDNVRTKISKDLAYTVEDRLIQIKRLFGIALLVIDNNYFPIVSSVYMTKKLAEQCDTSGLKLIQIKRNIESLRRTRSIYTTNKNVVGKDIEQEEIKSIVIKNFGDQNFKKELLSHVK